jgi:hypothetical protein
MRVDNEDVMTEFRVILPEEGKGEATDNSLLLSVPLSWRDVLRQERTGEPESPGTGLTTSPCERVSTLSP